MVSFNNCCLFVETTISLLVNAAIKTERKITMENNTLKTSEERILLSHFSRVRLCATPQSAAHWGSPIPGVLQARTLEWVAISFSSAWKWKVKGKSLSRIRLLATPWNAAYQAPSFIGFSRQECWSWVPLPSPRFLFKTTSCIEIKFNCFWKFSTFANTFLLPLIEEKTIKGNKKLFCVISRPSTLVGSYP